MGLFSRLKSIAVGPPETAVIADLRNEHVLVEGDDKGTALAPERSYYRVWLSESSLQHEREWFKDWHPGVQVAVTATTAGPTEEYANFVGPVQIPTFDEAPQRAVKLQHPVTPLLPFRGGTVALTAGLVAIQGDSVVKALINTVAGFGTLLGNPEIAAGTQVASKVVDGIEAMLGINANKLVLGFDRTYSSAGAVGAPNTFTSGYVAVLDTPNGSIDPRHLWVQDGRLLYRPTQAPAASPSVGYILVWIENRPTRDDWRSITTISEPYLKAVSSYNPAEKQAYYKQTITAARTHPLLTEADRVAFADQLKTQALADGGLGASGDIPGDLESFASTVTMSPSAALSARPPLASLLDF